MYRAMALFSSTCAVRIRSHSPPPLYSHSRLRTCIRIKCSPLRLLSRPRLHRETSQWPPAGTRARALVCSQSLSSHLWLWLEKSLNFPLVRRHCVPRRLWNTSSERASSQRPLRWRRPTRGSRRRRHFDSPPSTRSATRPAAARRRPRRSVAL